MAATIDEIGSPEDLRERSRVRRSRVFRAAATAVMAVGMLCPALGILLFVIHGFVTDDHALNNVGSGLLIASIPLLLIGSHLLDKADSVPDKIGE